ncbi:MAG: T9SS type A sorting domain-containing protein [Flavipsychrobacter sp.]|nr:T9SS type A sorting domain-containing protein [Flavipsychrobacter sp.]
MKANIYKIAAGCMAGILLSMSATSQTIYTFSGGAAGFAGDGGPATAAQLSRPAAIRYNSSGHICFADANNERIRRIESGSLTISTVAGSGSWGFSGDGAAATAAQLYFGGTGGDIVFDNSNNMYFADLYNQRVRKVTPAGIISTVAGDGSSGSSGDGGPATAARIWDPMGLAIDAAGNLYIAEHRGHRIRKIDVATGIITTIAGTGTAAYSGDGGPATAAEIGYPLGMIFDASGNLFVAEYSTGSIRKITPAGVISTHATGLFEPMYLDIDQAGNIFAGSEETMVYRISPSGVVDTVAGNGTTAATGDGGPATAAGMDQPVGVSVLSNGNLLISTRRNHRIRIVLANTATITGTASVCAGGTTSLTASEPGAVWKSGNTGVATVSSAGVVTGVAAGTATITYVKGLLFGTKVVTVNVPATPVITAAGSTLSVPATYATYQWSLGGTPISGATNATYNATTAGTYAVSVTDAGGCSATSANFVFSSVSVASVGKATDVQLFPNPAQGGSFTMNIPSGESEAVTIAVYNAMGQKVYETVAQTNKTLSMKLDVPAGMYLVKAVSSNANYHANVVVN